MNRQKIIIGSVILLSLVIFGLTLTKVFMKGQKPSEGEMAIPTEEIKDEIIPTVDSSVNISLEKAVDGKEVVLSMSNIPNKTKTIDYELSYQTEKQGLQGVIGTIKLDDEKSYKKQLTLGTCSSGTCVYHTVVGTIKLSLRFGGDYGERIFEKEVSL